MSASLVGSEMCIRDRSRIFVDELIKQVAADPDGFSFDAVELPPSVRTDAVSYTHLTLPTICSV
eukprot:5912817-Alexandrium_andersonii.AAC.1